MTPSDPGPPPPDVVDSAPTGDGLVRWSQWRLAQRRAAVVAVLLASAAGLGLCAVAVQDWWRDRVLRDVVEVQVELGVAASSLAWTPSGTGRVEYFLLLRNQAPRPARVTAVQFASPGLTVTGRRLQPRQVPPGAVAYVPLSVQLDCRHWRPAAPGTPLTGSVDVTAASGRSARVPTVVARAGPLLGVARTLCGLDPELRNPELSGPVRPA